MTYLRVEHLNVKIGSQNILSNVNFAVEQSCVVGILGPNGSGKSTLLRTLAGVQSSVNAPIYVKDELLTGLTKRQRSQTIAFVPQHSGAADDMTVIDILRLGRAPHRYAFSSWKRDDQYAVDKAMSVMRLESLAKRQWQHLSGGERQRCQIARALVQEPDVILLDEPINHLDIQFQLELMRLISTLPLTVVIALHDLNLAAKYCDSLIILKNGNIKASGKPSEILTKKNISNIWNVECEIINERNGHLHIKYN